MILNNARSLRLTAAAGTKLAGASLHSNVKQDVISTLVFLPRERTLQPEGLHRPRGVAPSGFRPLRKILDCSLPQESGQCLSPVWPDTLSGRLPIVTLVGRYPTNKLIGRRPLLDRQARRSPALARATKVTRAPSGISSPFGLLSRVRG